MFQRMLGVVALAAFVTAAPADDKAAPADQLAGTWKMSKPSKPLPPGLSVMLTIEKDGSMLMTMAAGPNKDEAKGTWKLDGKKLSVTYTSGPPKGTTETMTVEKLTDTTFVTVDDKGMRDEFERVKEKK